MRLTLFVAYELAALGTAALAVGLAVPSLARVANPRATALLATTLVMLLINGTLGFAVSVAGLNHPATYLVAVGLLALGLAAAGRGARPWSVWWGVVGRGRLTIAHGALVAAAAVFAPLAYASAYISKDIDTSHVLGYLILWSRNLSDPYENLVGQNGFPEFAETNYLPALVMGDSFVYAPLITLTVIACIWLATYLLLSRLGLPPTPAFLASLSQVVLWHFLAGSATGIPSIKPDLFLAAGVLTLAVAGVRLAAGELDRMTALLATAGIAFVNTRYSGFAYAGGWCAVAVAVAARPILAHRRAVLTWAAATAAVVLVSTGHYYVRNIVVYGTPLWPTTGSVVSKSEVLGVPVAERAGEKATIGSNLWQRDNTILSQLSERALWDELVNSSPLGGFWFLATFAAGLALPVLAALVWLVLRRSGRGGELDRRHLFAAAFAWVAFMLFIATPFSAKVGNLGNFRYGLGSLVLVECAALVALWKAVRSAPAAFGAIVGVAVGARAQAYYENSFIGIRDGVFLSLLLGIAIAGCAVAAARASRSAAVRSRVPLAAAPVAAVALALLWQGNFEENQRKEWGEWRPAFDRFWESRPLRIGLASDPGSVAPLYEGSPHPTFAIVAGRHLQNTTIRIDQSLPAAQIRDLDYVVSLEHVYKALPPGAQARFAEDAARKGFVVEHSDDNTVLARRRGAGE